MTDPDTPPLSAGTEPLPRHTTPTWEVEMLISGAAVFAMLQFPGWLGTHLLPLIPRFTSDIGAGLLLLSTYLTSTAIVLAITFMLHLILRARWIALVGMHSVFPDGVRWDRLRIGPVERDVSRQHDPGAATSIDRYDNRATVVFAFGTMLAITLLVLSLAVLVACAIAMGISLAGGHGIDTLQVFLAIVLLFLVPFVATIAWDRKLGSRMRKDGTGWRVLRFLMKCYARVGAVQGFTTSRLLESHVGSRRFQILTVVAMLPVVVGVALTLTTWNAPSRFGSYALFPQATGRTLHAIEPAHYDDQRDPVRDPATAYIQSEVVTGPYLQLTVPYLPARDDAALRLHCSAATAAHEAAARARARLDCLAALHPVTLDGKPLPSLQYAVSDDPRTRRPALQAMIDVRALAAGRHELRVGRAPAHPHRAHDAPFWTIAFWR